MKSFKMAAALFGLIVFLGGPTMAQAPAKSAVQPVCVVENHPIDRAVSADYQGGKVYFCSRECLAKFQADPAKYAMRAKYQLVVTGQAHQIACPFTGRPINPQIAPMKVCGLDIGFCCRACQQTVARADEATRFDLVFGDAFRTGFAVNKK
jgi:YHS domain-containing protein